MALTIFSEKSNHFPTFRISWNNCLKLTGRHHGLRIYESRGYWSKGQRNVLKMLLTKEEANAGRLFAPIETGNHFFPLIIHISLSSYEEKK